MFPNTALGRFKGDVLPRCSNNDLKGGVELLKILYILFSIITLVLAGYGVITQGKWTVRILVNNVLNHESVFFVQSMTYKKPYRLKMH